MIVLVRALDTDPADADFTKNVIGKILADHRDAQENRCPVYRACCGGRL